MIFNRINYRSLLANTWLLIGMAVAAAGGITWATYRYMLVSEARIKAEAAERREGPGVSVVVPRADVPAGTPLDSAVFVAREISADLVYDDMLQVDDFTHHRNAVLVKPVRRGRPLRLQDVDVTRARDFSDTLAAGMRALTLPIDAINSTDSMLRPGNRVDLYWVGTLSFVTRGGDPRRYEIDPAIDARRAGAGDRSRRSSARWRARRRATWPMERGAMVMAR
ncbi:Flp pilus assembly protein CpaB [Burkholderia gladioli]|uniref:Flp pilus assembly protein CpaB n=2 Tax=Burkholderia gladioli TaxID=28095 RepID=UPI003D1BA842